MATTFSETLVRLRRGAGFPTAYRFYYGSGGAAGLKLSYRKYLAMEQGKILPVFERLSPLLAGMKIVRLSEAGNELVMAWLKTMAGEQAYENLLEPILSARQKATSFSLADKAIKQSLVSRKHPVTPEQFSVIAEKRDNYLCFLALNNDASKWRPEELAKFMELPAAAASKALEALAKVRLLKKHRDGRYYSPFCGQLVEYPHSRLLPPEVVRKFMEHFTDLVENGKVVWTQVGTIRADLDALGDYLQLMQLNLSAACNYSITHRTRKSALFAVKGSIVKIRDF